MIGWTSPSSWAVHGATVADMGEPMKLTSRSSAERTRAYRQRRRLQLRSVRIRLSDAEIGALVRLGYLGNRDDIRAIEHAATAFISDALFGT